MQSTTLTVAQRYADAVAAKDFATVAGLFADDIVWHQPGSHRLAGTHRGAVGVRARCSAASRHRQSASRGVRFDDDRGAGEESGAHRPRDR